MVIQGRVHAYEGHPLRSVGFPVRLAHALGVQGIVLTNAAGGINPAFGPGTLMLITDHINLSFLNPLVGAVGEGEVRFPDMSDPYTAAWRQVARNVASEVGIPCQQGVFAAVPGPCLPTRAEYRYLKIAGADLVGMSMVPEVLAAVHSGFQVLALVGVTQTASVERHEPTSIEEMLDAADVAAPRIASLITGIVGSVK